MCNTDMLTPEAVAAAAENPAEQAFAEKLLGMINGGMAGLMISVGHRTGLFEAMKGAGSLTSSALADRSGLHERYVREWLGAMATAGIVALDRADGSYFLPDAHAAFLGRAAANGSMSSSFQFLAVLGQVETDIVECFRNGGGVPYSAFDRFHECMAEESGQTVLAGLEDHILPLVPGLAERLEAGIDVADVGCGVGRAMNRLAALYPASRFTGFDLSHEAILLAQMEARDLGLDNVSFEAVDATTLLGEALFDLIFTFDSVHDQAHPATVLGHIHRLLRPGGIYLMQDIDAATDVADNLDHRMGPFIYTVSCMHCMTVSLAQGGVGLGAAWGEQLAVAMLKDAGFGQIGTHRLPHDTLNVYYLCRPV
jgi:2-polyprenyl-3-methyl-5-hydroxy-6-metoxy-1,4-benzoquinol methylase